MPSGIYISENRKGGVKGRSGVYLKTKEHKQKIRDTLLRKGIKPNMSGIIGYWLGRKRVYKNPEERNRKIGLRMKGQRMGELHPRWVKDRTLLRDKHTLNSLIYADWRLKVFIRDNFKCKIANQDCKGQLEAHHILRWSQFLELRYEVNNGITLCHFHHPRKINDEMKLSPYFQELVKS